MKIYLISFAYYRENKWDIDSFNTYIYTKFCQADKI